MIYAKIIVPGLNRFCRGHFQDTPNVKTFFGYAGLFTLYRRTVKRALQKLYQRKPLFTLGKLLSKQFLLRGKTTLKIAFDTHEILIFIDRVNTKESVG